MPDSEVVRTVRRRAIVGAVFPTLAAILLAASGTNCGPPPVVLFLVLPLSYAIVLLAADIVATLGRGRSSHAAPKIPGAFRVAAIVVPLLAYLVVAALRSLPPQVCLSS